VITVSALGLSKAVQFNQVLVRFFPKEARKAVETYREQD